MSAPQRRQKPIDERRGVAKQRALIAKLALEAVRRANELTKGKSYFVLDTLAVALYRTGDFADAAATEEKAFEQLKAEVKNPSHPYFKSFAEQIEKFRKAAAEKGGRAANP